MTSLRKPRRLTKRIRKKYHIGEFAHLGFQLKVAFEKGAYTNSDRIYDDFINYIEKNNLYCGGSIGYDFISVIIHKPKKCTTQQDIDIIKEYFTDMKTTSVVITDNIDLWWDEDV